MLAWFEAFVARRWYTFDATQAAPRGGRIVIAYGRDAVDVALKLSGMCVCRSRCAKFDEGLPATFHDAQGSLESARDG